MKPTTTLGLATFALAAMAASGAAQQPTNDAKSTTATAAPTSTKADSAKKETPQKVSLFRPKEINHLRPADMRGLNVFEAPKDDEVPFTGFVLSFGGAFTQEFQGLAHSNTATPVLVNNVNSNQL